MFSLRLFLNKNLLQFFPAKNYNIQYNFYTGLTFNLSQPGYDSLFFVSSSKVSFFICKIIQVGLFIKGAEHTKGRATVAEMLAFFSSRIN